MKLLKINAVSCAAMAVLGTLFSCQVEENTENDVVLEPLEINDAHLSAVFNGSNCKTGKRNSERDNRDLDDPVNVGKIDDRTCYEDYFEIEHTDGKTYGYYQIREDSNHLDNINDNGTPDNPNDDRQLQPRIERSLPRSTTTTAGGFAQLTGRVRILQVGEADSGANFEQDDMRDKSGTYIAQAKGTHRGGGGSPDPAICLFVAKPANADQTSFNIYREQIKYRGGSGVNGRELVFLTTVRRGVPTNFEMRIGFKNEGGELVHYVYSKIGSHESEFLIPRPDLGNQSGIRYGAYRVHNGKGRIQWADTEYTRK